MRFLHTVHKINAYKGGRICPSARPSARFTSEVIRYLPMKFGIGGHTNVLILICLTSVQPPFNVVLKSNFIRFHKKWLDT